MLPAGAEDDTPAAAVTFAEFWIDTLDWGYATTSSALARQWYAKSCSDCELFMKTFDNAKKLGYSFRGGRIYVLGGQVAENDKRFGAQFAVDVTLASSALTVVNRAGKVLERDPATAKITFRLWVERVSHRWAVVAKARVT